MWENLGPRPTNLARPSWALSPFRNDPKRGTLNAKRNAHAQNAHRQTAKYKFRIRRTRAFRNYYFNVANVTVAEMLHVNHAPRTKLNSCQIFANVFARVCMCWGCCVFFFIYYDLFINFVESHWMNIWWSIFSFDKCEICFKEI